MPQRLKELLKGRKNILVLVEHFGQGGAEKAAATIAGMLSETELYSVFLYSVYKPSALPQLNGLEVGSLDIETRSFAGKLLSYFTRLKRLRDLKKRLNIDLTLSSLWPVDWLNYVTGGEKKIAIIQINILNNEQNKKMVKFSPIVSYIYNRFDKIVMGSSNLFVELSGFFKIQKHLLITIHNPVDTKLISQNIKLPLTELPEHIFEKYNVLVAANRLHPIKNTTALIPILQALSPEYNAKLLIIGEGEEEALLKEKIIGSGFRYAIAGEENFDETASVYLLKFQSNIHNIISKSRIFLFPTKGEGLPLALIEAMYCRIPVLVSDCPNGGVFELLKGQGDYNSELMRKQPEWVGGGYLMPIPVTGIPETISAWKEKVEEILNAPIMQIENMGERNEERAKEFDKDIIKRKWLHLIAGLTDGNE